MPAPDFLPMPETDAPTRPNWPEVGRITLPDEAATDALAARLATHLAAGDTLLLSGALGAGKTHLARALIRARMASPEEPVPSPSFTLVQTYQTPDGVDIWHADLYQLGDAGEVAELGLDDALGQAICLIEWPDRLAPDWPDAAVMVHLDRAANDMRTARLLSPLTSNLAPRLLQAFRP